MNRSVSLIRYALTPKGWRRGAAVVGKSGRLKPDYMMLGGEEVHCPTGRYQLVRYEGKKPVYTDVGNDATEALAHFRIEEAKASAKAAAQSAGLEVLDDRAKKTLKRYADEFLEMHRSLPHRSDDSVSMYTLVCDLFVEVAKARYPKDVTKEDVVRFYAAMRDKMGWSDRTRSNRYTALRGFLRHCGIDPAKLIDKGTHTLLKKYLRKKPNSYTPEIVDKLVVTSLAAGDEENALLWDFAYRTGLRDSELQHVARYDFHGLDTDNPVVYVKERDKHGRIKDAEERIVELHPSLVPKIKQWMQDHPKKVLLFGTSTDQPDSHMLRALKRTARAANLNCGHCDGCVQYDECREYTLHRFRRSFATRLLKASGGDFVGVMKRTGHANVETLRAYLDPGQESMRQAVNAAF